MATLTEREIELTDLILQQLEEDKESNSTSLAEYEHLEHLSDEEKKERYWYLYRLVSRHLKSNYIHDDKNISMKVNHKVSEAIKKFRAEGGVRKIQQAERSRIWKLRSYFFGSR